VLSAVVELLGMSRMWVCRVAPGVTGIPRFWSFKDVGGCFSTDIALKEK